MNILTIAGSLRSNSLNQMAADYVASNLEAGVNGEVLDFSQVPLFNEDLEADFPPMVADVKKQIIAADGVMFFTPEYNRSIPGVLKNLIDWTTRPHKQNIWPRKPVAITCVAISQLRGVTVQYQLKQLLSYLGARVMWQPETYILAELHQGNRPRAISDDNQERLDDFVGSFVKHIRK